MPNWELVVLHQDIFFRGGEKVELPLSSWWNAFFPFHLNDRNATPFVLCYFEYY